MSSRPRTPPLATAVRFVTMVSAGLLLPAAGHCQQTTSTWSSATNGTWSDASKWSTPDAPNNGTPPGTTYLAVIDVDGGGTAYVVTLNSDVTVDRVTLDAADARLHHTSGTLQSVNPIVINDGRFNLMGGTILNSTIQSDPTSSTPGRTTATASTTTLDGVTINGTVFVDGGSLTILNGLTLSKANDGLWFQGNAGKVLFDGDQTLSGIGEVVYAQSSGFRGTLAATTGHTLTIGSDVTIRVADGPFNTLGAADAGLVINGTVQSLQSTRSITITGDNWVNNGLLDASGNGTINLDGIFTTAGLGVFHADNLNGRVQVTGTLDNTGATLALSDLNAGGTGSMTLKAGGTISGGTISTDSETSLRVNTGNNTSVLGPGVLDGVTLQGELRMLQGEAEIHNSLTLDNGVIRYDDNLGTPILTFVGNQTLGGTGEVVFDNTIEGELRPDAGSTLTIGSGVTVRTGLDGGHLGQAAGDLINDGTVSAQTGSRTLSVHGDAVTNNGTFEAKNGGTLQILSNSFVNNGTLTTGDLSAIVFGGTLTNDGLIEGTGTLDSGVSNNNAISPGTSTGFLTIADLSQTSTGRLQFELGGLTRGTEYDALIAEDILAFDGTVDVDLIPGFTPMLGNSFDLLDWTTALFGDYMFDFTDAVLPSGLAWDTSAFESSGVITVNDVAVPEPHSLLYMALGLAAIGWRRRNR